MKKIFVISIFAFLVGCAKDLKFYVTNIEFLSNPKQFSGYGSNIKVKGVVVLTIQTDVDIVQTALDNSYNIWFDVKNCATGQELHNWSGFYPSTISENGLYSYDLIVYYKSKWSGDKKYSIINDSFYDICLKIGMANMNPFSGSFSDDVPIKLPPDIINKMMEYESAGGEVKFEKGKDCKWSDCSVDYSSPQ